MLNADDPLVAELGTRACARDASASASTTRRRARPALQHAADSKYCLRCGAPYDYAAAYVGHLGDYRCPDCGHARPPLDVAAARDRAARARRRSLHARDAGRARARVELALPGLYNVYNALARGGARRCARRAARRRSRPGSARFSAAFGRFERIAVGDRRAADAADQEPGGRERGGAHARRRRRPARSRSSRSTTTIADGRDVSWIWDVDFEPLLAGLEPRRRYRHARGRAGAAFRVRRAAPASGSRSIPTSRRRSTAALELTPAGGELVVLPTYTAMLALRGIVAARGHVANYWERAA